MDISAAGLSNLKQSQIKEEVGVAVAKKAMDLQKQQGQVALDLLESAASTKPITPGHVGQRLSVTG